MQLEIEGRRVVFTLAFAIACVAITLVLPLHAQAQTYTVLHTFLGSEGVFPTFGLVRDSAGNLYGATEYGGDFGSSGAYLPNYPDSFAELSLLDHNPYPAFTFADANALGNLPYGTAVRVTHDGDSKVLIKRDVGYGQGPGQAIPYRLDVYQASAPALNVPACSRLAPNASTRTPARSERNWTNGKYTEM